MGKFPYIKSTQYRRLYPTNKRSRTIGFYMSTGNHGEDVKECYYYLDSLPTHSYMKAQYKYPQNEYPYQWLVEENRRRTVDDLEFELCDTGG